MQSMFPKYVFISIYSWYNIIYISDIWLVEFFVTVKWKHLTNQTPVSPFFGLALFVGF